MTSPIRTLTNTIETKVIASTAGGGAGAAVATFLLWLLGVAVWHAPDTASKAVEAVAAVPSPVAALIGMAVVIAGGFLAGYLAPHTSRSPGAHSTDSATPLSLTPADLTSAPVGAEPVAAEPLAGTPPPLTADLLLNLAGPSGTTPLDGPPAAAVPA